MKSKTAILAALFAFAAFATATIGGFADTPALQNYGSLTSTGSVGVRNLTNQSTCTTTVSGGATKTITFEGEGNGPSTGSSYIALPDTGTYSALNTTTFQGSTPATTATADGLYVTPVAGLTGFRARVSSYGSGTVNITVFCTAGVLASTSTSSGGGGGSGATPIPYASDGNGVQYSHPTGVPTFAPAPTPIPWTTGSPEPAFVTNATAFPSPIPWSLASPEPIALPTSFQSSFPTPIPVSAFPTAAPFPTASAGSTQSPYLDSLKKSSAVMTTAALGASGVYTGSWIDTTADNTSLVNVEAYSAVGAGTLVIQETNDTSGTLSGFPIQVASIAVSAASATKVEYQITARYWRVVYTNSTTAQTTFEIAYTASGVPSSDNVGTRSCDYLLFTSCSSVGSLTGTLNGVNALTTRSIIEAMPGAGSSGYPNTGDKDGTNNYSIQAVTPGGAFKTVLTSASATACTAIETNTAGRFVTITNTGPATTVFPQFYDEGASPTCAAADLIWGDGSTIVVPGAGSPPLVLNIPLTAGLAYKLSGALTANLIITRN